MDKCFHLMFTIIELSYCSLTPAFVRNQVLFVCTANAIEMIPNPLLDRMEIISIAGYITDEKMHIARDYLEKNTREASGIKPELVHTGFLDSFENTESPRKMYLHKNIDSLSILQRFHREPF